MCMSSYGDVSSQKEPWRSSISHLAWGLYRLAHGCSRRHRVVSLWVFGERGLSSCAYSLSSNTNQTGTAGASSSLQDSARGQSIKENFLYF